jgi:hypothetical protein
MDKGDMTKNKNRRVSFRIYDEVNLFYKKIDEKLVTEPHPVFDNISNTSLSSNTAMDSQLLPDLQFKENETHHVNISASGMAFNCEESLKEGDYLVIKILLASSMAVIVTYGQVVFCTINKISDSQDPYFVGAHFINMEDEYQDLLSKHVAKKRVQQRWVNGFILAAVITVIAAPAMVFSLAVGLLHFLLEVSLHVMHLAFEFLESNLDHLVEHVFETDVHQTQIIVFYIIVPFVLYGLYRLLRAVPSFCRRLKKNQIAFWSRKKAGLLFYWHEQSLLNKIKLIVIGIAVITGYVFFGI